MILFDTTVLVYAVGAEHPLRQPCRDLIAALREGRLRASTTPEVLQEFAHVRARRRARSDAGALARDFGQLLRPLVVVDEDDLRDGLDLFERHDELGAFDAVLAAAALRRGARALVSADRSFGSVEALRYVDPSEPDLLARLEP
ncbi:MAG: PIN domain-containing protein [Egibacteraceae bacterium]